MIGWGEWGEWGDLRPLTYRCHDVSTGYRGKSPQLPHSPHIATATGLSPAGRLLIGSATANRPEKTGQNRGLWRGVCRAAGDSGTERAPAKLPASGPTRAPNLSKRLRIVKGRTRSDKPPGASRASEAANV